MKRSAGFTIVEIIVVVIVVGILATLGVILFTQMQTNARNDERASDLTILSDALEEYYRKNNAYPSCANMTQGASTVASLIEVDANALKAPTAAAGTNSISCGALTAASPDVYGYVVGTTSTCTAGTYCLEYTLQYRQEGTNAIISEKSLRCGTTGYGTCERPGV